MEAPRPSLDDIFSLSIQNSNKSKPSLDEIFSQSQQAIQESPNESNYTPEKQKWDIRFGNPAFALGSESDYKPSLGSNMFKYGASNEGAKMIPDVLQTAATMAVAPINPLLAIPAGAAARGMGEYAMQKRFGQDTNFGRVGQQAMFGAASEALPIALLSGAKKLANPSVKLAKRMMTGILKPKGQLRKKHVQIANTALKEELSGSKPKMLEQAYQKIGNSLKQVDDILSKYSDRTITAEQSLKNLDDLKASYLRDGFVNEARKVDSVKMAVIKAHKLNKPVYEFVEKGQFTIPQGSESVSQGLKMADKYKGEPTGFVMGGESKQVYPKLIKKEARRFGILGDEMTPQKSYSVIDDLKVRDTPKVESRSARVVRDPKITETTSVMNRPETIYGVSKMEPEIVGETLREIPISEGQLIKKGQYNQLGKSNAYNKIMNPAGTEARKVYARGYRQAIEEAIPEEPIAQINRRASDLIDVSKSLEERIPISDRNDLLGLKDYVIGGMSLANPSVAPVAIASKLSRIDPVVSSTANALYKLGKNPALYDIATRSPYRNLTSAALARMQDAITA